jgi:hypothetical protein
MKINGVGAKAKKHLSNVVSSVDWRGCRNLVKYSFTRAFKKAVLCSQPFCPSVYPHVCLHVFIPVSFGSFLCLSVYLLNIERNNGTVHIRHQCRETAVLNCHGFLINSGVEKMNNV